MQSSLIKNPPKHNRTVQVLGTSALLKVTIKAYSFNSNYFKIVHIARVSICFICSRGFNFQKVPRSQALQLWSLQTAQMEWPKTDVLHWLKILISFAQISYGLGFFGGFVGLFCFVFSLRFLLHIFTLRAKRKEQSKLSALIFIPSQSLPEEEAVCFRCNTYIFCRWPSLLSSQDNKEKLCTETYELPTLHVGTVCRRESL